jgi:hypothetical protein
VILSGVEVVCAAPKLFMIEELEVEGEVPLPQQYLEEDDP